MVKICVTEILHSPGCDGQRPQGARHLQQGQIILGIGPHQLSEVARRPDLMRIDAKHL